jgi:hypothetical protein
MAISYYSCCIDLIFGNGMPVFAFMAGCSWHALLTTLQDVIQKSRHAPALWEDGKP